MSREYTKSEQKWIKEFKALMRRSPKNLELIVTYGEIDVYESGCHSEHLGSEFDSWGMSSNPTIKERYFESIRTAKLTPYTEGT